MSQFSQVTTKIPPSFDGKTSSFALEDAIDDWCDIIELHEEKAIPTLRNRLEGNATIYKEDPGQGKAEKRRGWHCLLQADSEAFLCDGERQCLLIPPSSVLESTARFV